MVWILLWCNTGTPNIGRMLGLTLTHAPGFRLPATRPVTQALPTLFARRPRERLLDTDEDVDGDILLDDHLVLATLEMHGESSRRP
jgi:hypothetical protein